MKNPIVILVIGIIASIFLGSFSNWIYDLLKASRFFPNANKLTIRTFLFVFLCIIILILLVALPDISDQDLKKFQEFISQPIPLWIILIMCLISGFIGFLSVYFKLRDKQKQLTEKEKTFNDMQKKLAETELRLDQIVGLPQRRSGTVIKPK